MSDSLQPHGLHHARPPCPSPTPRVFPKSCPLSQWWHPTSSSSVIPFFSCLQCFPASGSFQMSQLFPSGGRSIGVSASTSVLPMNTRDWSLLGWTGCISLHVSLKPEPCSVLPQCNHNGKDSNIKSQWLTQPRVQVTIVQCIWQVSFRLDVFQSVLSSEDCSTLKTADPLFCKVSPTWVYQMVDVSRWLHWGLHEATLCSSHDLLLGCRWLQPVPLLLLFTAVTPLRWELSDPPFFFPVECSLHTLISKQFVGEIFEAM